MAAVLFARSSLARRTDRPNTVAGEGFLTCGGDPSDAYESRSSPSTQARSPVDSEELGLLEPEGIHALSCRCKFNPAKRRDQGRLLWRGKQGRFEVVSGRGGSPEASIQSPSSTGVIDSQGSTVADYG